MPDQFKLASPCYIVSDHHLGAAPEDSERAFVRFLRALEGNAAALLINGDLFDFWFEWRTVVPRTGYRVLAGLASLAEAGTQIVWIGGNHDCWGGDFLRESVGIRYQLGAWQGEIAGWRARIEHGDGLRVVEDRGYRALRSVIRHPLAIAGMRLLHPDVGTWLATRSSQASRVHRARDEGAGLRSIAERVLAAPDAPELYVLGHSHVPTLEQVAPGRVYANAGSWSDGGSHLVVTEGRIALVSDAGSTEVNRLDAADRAT